MARVQDTDRPDVDRKAILLMAGDHGVVAEGVSPYPQDVTWQMVANFVAGGAAINQIAAQRRRRGGASTTSVWPRISPKCPESST